MGIKNNHHHHHHHNQISSFNPTLCLRPSIHPQPPTVLIKDILPSDDSLIVVPPKHVQLFLSPRIGCMGQVKRSYSTGSSKNHHHSHKDNKSKKKLFQFQRMFSNVSGRSSNSRGSAKVDDNRDCLNTSSRRRDDDISIADTMDLPLPVVRRQPRRDGEVCSLWTRRRGGDGLQLQGMERLRDNSWSGGDYCRLAA